MPDGRTESLRIRVSSSEKKAMQDRAAGANVTVSELVREALLGRSDLAISAAAGARREGQPKTRENLKAVETAEQRLDRMREDRERRLAEAN